MSKIITQRYEYALYDDAAGILSPAKDVPPTYPPTLDTFRFGSVSSVAQSYGVQNLVGTGATTIATPPNARTHIFSPVSNTTLLAVLITGAIPTLNAAPVNVTMYVAPGQTVTIPDSINSGSITVTPYTLALAPTSAAFTANVMWSA